MILFPTHKHPTPFNPPSSNNIYTNNRKSKLQKLTLNSSVSKQDYHPINDCV